MNAETRCNRMAESYVKLAAQVMDYLRTGTMRVLLVEDNPMDVELFREQLASLPTRYSVDVASDGEAAKKAIRELRHHVVVIDYHLGDGQNGLEIARELHREGVEFPFLFLTGQNKDFRQGAVEDSLGWLDKASCTTAELDNALVHAVKNYHTRRVACLS